ncbi:50S ribosomal protein L11 methyltransferase [Bradyrhizobium sp. LHD-71]|uniref:50S ribosomal protein L11 methyltransferase n=1 Tax=Bradyrhizobium sp. LHD-71 TaxID=3072141 RepID=UPI00280C586D|nr:50S ribosomal protein L11 methyltransferase [Bradyrhizobium sp. LHD-71]MDQ8729417.1 50S ribosomal protein L11 methyltransferase [Bradyrhizobium sp. LHD-71]
MSELLARRGAPQVYSLPRQLFRKFVHWASYNFILTSKRTRTVRVGDLQLVVLPSVFHPGIFLTSRIFSAFLRSLDLAGKSVIEVGTGSGILALSAARAGARSVLALDINPAAVSAAQKNAAMNGLSAVVSARVSDLLSAARADEIVDVIISSPPSFSGEPRDMADRAWHAGPSYRDITSLFDQAYRHLANDGVMYVLLSSDTDVVLMETLAREANFGWQEIERHSIWVEAFMIYRLAKRPLAA